MPNAVISYDVNTPMGQQVRAACVELASAMDRLSKVSALLTQADAATTPTVIETGGAVASLLGVAAGQGAAFTAAVTGLAGALNAPNRAQLAQLFKG